MVESIEFKLSLGKEQYLLGEPAISYLEVANIGDEAALILDQLDPAIGIVKIYVKNGGQETMFLPYVVADSMRRETMLNLGESVKGSAKVFYGGNGWTFSSVGKYQVRATYSGLVSKPGYEIGSNLVQVNVRGPQNEQEKDQLDLMMGEEQGLFLLFEGGDHLEKAIENLTQLSSKYPLSDFAGYANFALGMNYSRDFADFQKSLVRKADMNKSLLYLKTVKDRNVESYFIMQAYFTLATIYDYLGTVDTKKEVLSEFIGKFSRDNKFSENVKKAKMMLEKDG